MTNDDRPWWELALNPKVVLADYTAPPPLDPVQIDWVRFDADAAAAVLQLELPRFPDKPSPRWWAGSNAAQIELRFVDVREVAMAGWATTNVGRLSLEPSCGGIAFVFAGPTVRLNGFASFFDVVRITGYAKETS